MRTSTPARVPAAPVRGRFTAGVTVLLTLLATLTIGLGSARPADAAMPFGARIVKEAAVHRGAPYVWGATGPRRFDCSGYTMYVYAKLGKHLPHNSAAQYRVVRHIAKSAKQPGDLLFFRSHGRISHVAIYAGGNAMWHSPHSGSVVRRVAIYSAAYSVGRP